MKTWPFWQVVLMAVGLAFGMINFPLATILIGGILLVVYRESQVVSTGKLAVMGSKKFVVSLLSATAVAIFAHIIFSHLFGVSMLSVKNAGGLLVLLRDPAKLTGEVFREVIALIAVFAIFYLWYTSPKPRRWLYRTALIVSVGYLAVTSFYTNYVGQSPRDGFTRFYHGVSQWLGSSLDEAGQISQERSELTALQGKMPRLIQQLVAAAAIYQTESGKIDLTTGKLYQAGTRWRVYTKDSVTDSEVVYVKVAAVDGTASGYADVSILGEKANPKPQSVVVPVPPVTQAEPVAVGSTPAQPDTQTPATPPAKRDEKEDIVLASSDDWTESIVIPRNGDIIEFGPFDKAEDVSRIASRTGGESITVLEPVEIWDGRYIGRVTCQGGPNKVNAPERIKLTAGEPLSVKIKKVSGGGNP